MKYSILHIPPLPTHGWLRQHLTVKQSPIMQHKTRHLDQKTRSTLAVVGATLAYKPHAPQKPPSLIGIAARVPQGVCPVASICSLQFLPVQIQFTNQGFYFYLNNVASNMTEIPFHQITKGTERGKFSCKRDCKRVN